MVTTWLKVPEAAEYAGVSRDTIYTACERGELKHARIGGRRAIRLRAEWIDAWLEQHARDPNWTGSLDTPNAADRWRLTSIGAVRRKGRFPWVCISFASTRDERETDASFRGVRASLTRWTDREIRSKAEADVALDELRRAVRTGTFDERGLELPREVTTLTFREFADIYKQRHVQAKRLAAAKTIDYRLKPLIERFGDRTLLDIKTVDIEDFIADLKRPRVVNSQQGRTLALASINRAVGLLRHMMNWAVGREYLDRTPFRRGTEVLIRLEREDNKRRRRLSEEEESSLLAVASPSLRSMIIAALDTGMRRGEMLSLRFGDIDWKRQLIILRGATTKEPSNPTGSYRHHAASCSPCVAASGRRRWTEIG